MTAAGGALLSLAELLAGVNAELEAELRRERQLPDEAGSAAVLQEVGRHLCFTLAGQHLAIPLSLVVEVGELETVRPLPFLPDWVDGVTNIRGEIVSVTNMAAFFRLAASKSRAFIFIQDSGMKTAVTVERITGTRLLQRREGMSRGSGRTAVPPEYLNGPALYAAEDGERRLELFDGQKLLAAIRLQQ
jgi:purine-binding chemotaxis protein CheW